MFGTAMRPSISQSCRVSSLGLILGLNLLLTLWTTHVQGCPKYEADYALLEIAYVRESKELICPVPEQCVASWTKDGQPFTFDPDESEYELRCNGRELNFRSVALSDAGVYACSAESCEGAPQPQAVTLMVQEKPDIMKPLNMPYTQCTDQAAQHGGNITFCCKFHVGSADSLTFSFWQRGGEVCTCGEGEGPQCKLETGQVLTCAEEAAQNVRYDPERELVTCVSVTNVSDVSYGNYTVFCSNSKGNTNFTVELTEEVVIPNHPSWYLPVVCALSSCFGLTVLLAAVSWHHQLDIRLALKDQFGAQETEDGMQYDAFIAHCDSDVQTAMDLSKRLTQLDYTVFKEDDILPGSVTAEEISCLLRESRRYIILLSPQFLESRFATHTIDQCLDLATDVKNHIIPLFLQTIPDTQLQQNTALYTIVSAQHRRRRLDWHDHSPQEMQEPMSFSARESSRKLSRAEQRVWKTVRLCMPPRPLRKSCHTDSHSSSGGYSRLNCADVIS